MHTTKENFKAREVTLPLEPPVQMGGGARCTSTVHTLTRHGAKARSLGASAALPILVRSRVCSAYRVIRDLCCAMLILSLAPSLTRHGCLFPANGGQTDGSHCLLRCDRVRQSGGDLKKQ